jgi:uncharacterized glyoxalase superfamily protein PhnB
MTDDLDPLRSIRPDRVLPDDPPDPDVLAREKARFMSSIAGAPAEARRVPSIYPRLAYADEVAALEFLVRAFGLTERREVRMELPGGTLAWLELGDGVVMIGRSGEERHGLQSPHEAGGPTGMVMVSVRDIDAHYERARAEGARIVMELEDMFWGDRRYEALDLEGHRWHFAERVAADPLARREPTSHERMSGQAWDASYTGADPAPWDIGGPQPAVVRAAAAGGLRGRVLDAGCGSGENALYLASLGSRVVGFDVAPTAIETARAQAAARGLDAEFVVADAFALERLGRTFDSVLDCGLFHAFDADERRRYVASLASVTAPGATVCVLCFADEGADPGPHPVSRADLHAAFDPLGGWRIVAIEAERIHTNFHGADGAPAWLARVTRA